jgi:hypothetical protein
VVTTAAASVTVDATLDQDNLVHSLLAYIDLDKSEILPHFSRTFPWRQSPSPIPPIFVWLMNAQGVPVVVFGNLECPYRPNATTN